MKLPNQGIYAITQTENRSHQQILEQTEAALRGGTAVLQYRNKSSQDAELAGDLFSLCQHYHIPFIVNDDIELAAALKADGVHLGQDDGNIKHARQRLGPDAIIGISCYNDLDRALDMEHAGANYVAFGRFFPSSSKPLARPAHIQTLRQAKQQISIPIVAIGGILPENGQQLLEAGADFLAIIGGIFNHKNPEQATREYQKLFHSQTA